MLKTIVTIFISFYVLIGYSQTDTAYISQITVNEELVYQFNHQVNYFPELEQRLINYPNREKEIIKSLTIDDYVCKIIFHENVATEEKNETLLFLANGLSFRTYKLED